MRLLSLLPIFGMGMLDGSPCMTIVDVRRSDIPLGPPGRTMDDCRLSVLDGRPGGSATDAFRRVVAPVEGVSEVDAKDSEDRGPTSVSDDDGVVVQELLFDPSAMLPTEAPTGDDGCDGPRLNYGDARTGSRTPSVTPVDSDSPFSFPLGQGTHRRAWGRAPTEAEGRGVLRRLGKSDMDSIAQLSQLEALCERLYNAQVCERAS